MTKKFKFQLTRSRGAWPETLYDETDWEDFNSHAHVERDGLPYSENAGKYISTHTLTWSVTRAVDWQAVTLWISTHTLTWSVTSGLCYELWGRLWFQLTRSRGAWRLIPLLLKMILQISTHTLTWSVTLCYDRNGRPYEFQLTRSRGAWRFVFWHNDRQFNFNSHAHVERDIWVRKKFFRFSISTHTLTWSVTDISRQGGV